jgi:hypothetical protein
MHCDLTPDCPCCPHPPLRESADAHTDTSTAEFALLEHGARCPAPLKLDPCLTLVALAVWHHCRLRLWPARGGQQHACKGVAFKGIVSGEPRLQGYALLG